MNLCNKTNQELGSALDHSFTTLCPFSVARLDQDQSSIEKVSLEPKCRHHHYLERTSHLFKRKIRTSFCHGLTKCNIKEKSLFQKFTFKIEFGRALARAQRPWLNFRLTLNDSGPLYQQSPFWELIDECCSYLNILGLICHWNKLSLILIVRLIGSNVKILNTC